jgi:hypothetical protein
MLDDEHATKDFIEPPVSERAYILFEKTLGAYSLPGIKGLE